MKAFITGRNRLAFRLGALLAALFIAALCVMPALAAETSGADAGTEAETQAGLGSDAGYQRFIEESGILSGTDAGFAEFAQSRTRIEPDNDYDDMYFDTWCVLMRVHRNRSIDVTESFDVYFNSPMHGMTRTLPSYSSAESFKIRKLRVYGADFHTTEDTIYLGSSDVTVTGMQHYVITYTIANFEDTYDGYDRLYRDIVGSEVQKDVYNVYGGVILDKGMTFDDVTIYSGRHGGSGNEYVDYSFSGGSLLVYGNRELGSYNAVTVDAKLPEGAYSEPALLQPDYYVDSLDVRAKLDKYGVMQVTESYDLTVISEEPCSFSRTIPDYDGQMDKKISNVKIAKNGAKPVSSGNSYNVTCELDPAEGKTAHIDLSYEIKFVMRTDQTENVIQISLVNYDDVLCKYGKVNAEIETPFELSDTLDHAGVFTGNYVDLEEYEDNLYEPKYYFVTDTQGNTITSRLEGAQMPIGETVTLEMQYLKDVLERRPLATDGILSFLSVGGIGALIWAFLTGKKKEKQLTPSVQYYPPAGLNPAEVGFIIDNECENRDVTSLIYYWASKGYLAIEVPKKGSGFTLHKLKDLPAEHRTYERSLFNKMFSYGKDGSVKDTQLSTKLYSEVSSAASKVKNVFTGSQRFYNPVAEKLSSMLPLAVPIVIWLGAWGAAKAWGAPDSASTTLAFGGIISFFAARYLRNGTIKQYKAKKAGKVVSKVLCWGALAVAFLIMMSCGGGALSYAAAVLSALLIAVDGLIAPKLLRRTDYYTDLLGLVVGFKQFLETAEKDRLKMLLDENPTYYYDILPYAQVLGVSKQWLARFDGLTMQAPTWFYGPAVTPYTLNSMLDRNMTRMNSSMTSVPASSSSGGGFSGGSFGGGFSGGGGGFSGGGGGGGAGGW